MSPGLQRSSSDCPKKKFYFEVFEVEKYFETDFVCFMQKVYKLEFWKTTISKVF